jgi:hypothetical protein
VGRWAVGSGQWAVGHSHCPRNGWPSPLGIGWPAAGVFTSRSGPGEGSVRAFCWSAPEVLPTAYCFLPAGYGLGCAAKNDHMMSVAGT